MLKKFRSITTILIVSTLIGIARSNWIIVWVCLEVNALAICWIISKDRKIEKSQESNIFLYYIIQVIASIFLLGAALTQQTTASSTILVFSILIKIGAWPTHLWYIKLIRNIEIKQNSILVVITWQKILPISLVIRIVEKEEIKILLLVIAISTLVTPVSNLTANLSLKRILGVSSFNNNGWLLIARLRSIFSFFTFLFLYSTTLLVTLKRIIKLTTKRIKITTPFWSSTLVVRNIGGLPPFTIFWAKVILVKAAITARIPRELLLLIVIVACYFLYHYLWALLNEISWNPKKSQNSLKDKKQWESIKMITATRIVGFILIITLGLT